MPSRLLALPALLCMLLLAGCGGSDDRSRADETKATPAPIEQAQDAASCRQVAKPAPKPEGDEPKPTSRLKAGETYVAKVSTSCGDFAITLDAKRAPKTGGSFASLVRKRFYDGLVFHRIVAGFVIQAGDPKGTGEGGPGYSVVEKPPDGLTYTKGVVAMAKTATEAPGTSGSQFFVVTADDAQLPPEYALLGKVTEGQDVVDRIGAVPVGPDEAPADPVVIRSIKLDTAQTR